MAFVDDKKEAVVNQDQKGESKEDVAAAKSKDGDAKATKPDTPPENEKKGEKGKGEQEKPVEKDDAAPPPPLFPDKALESAVRAVVFEKRFNEEPLTKEDVAKIPHVIGRGKGIKSLKGLEHCVSLMKIDLEETILLDTSSESQLLCQLPISRHNPLVIHKWKHDQIFLENAYNLWLVCELGSPT